MKVSGLTAFVRRSATYLVDCTHYKGKFAQSGFRGVQQGKVAVVAEGGVEEVEIEYSAAGVDI